MASDAIQKWEYKVVEIQGREIDYQLDNAGLNGWELVAVHDYSMIFKRPLKEPQHGE